MNNELLTDVREYLCGADGASDKLLGGYIARGEARLQEIAGVPLDFAAEALPRQLLLDYCMYAEAKALADFEKNYAGELLTLVYDYAIKHDGERKQHGNKNTHPL